MNRREIAGGIAAAVGGAAFLASRQAKADAPIYVGPPASQQMVEATRGVVAQTLSSHTDNVLNVHDFGAIGDGTADDTAAFNALAAYVQSTVLLTTGSYGSVGVSIALARGRVYRLNGTWNLVAMRQINVVIEGNGSTIASHATGLPAVDALYSRFIRFENLTVIGDATNTPATGIQFGRALTPNTVADCLVFANVTVTGSFTTAAVYNLASEDVQFDHCRFWNAYQPGSGANSSYCLIQDSANQFGVPAGSAAVAAYIAANPSFSLIPANTANSFNENLFNVCDFRHFATTYPGVPIYMAQCSRHRYNTCYLMGTGSTGIVMDCRYLDSTGVTSFRLLDLDIHCEVSTGPSTGLASVFRFQGAPATSGNVATIRGFRYRDHSCEAITAVFTADTTGTYGTAIPTTAGICLEAVEIETPAFSQTPVMFDTPSVYNLQGRVHCDAGNVWNGPNIFNGIHQTTDVNNTTFGPGGQLIFDCSTGVTYFKGQFIQVGTATLSCKGNTFASQQRIRMYQEELDFLAPSSASTPAITVRGSTASTSPDSDITALTTGTELRFRTGGYTAIAQALYLDANQSVVAGKGNLGPTATSGFLYIPIISGDPTATPASKAGFAPICFNPTDNKLWIYNQSAWVSATL